MFFCEKLNKSPFANYDLHPRNIMKDKYGNFKIIDYDKLQLKYKE